MSQILRAKKRFDLGDVQNAIEVWSIGNIDHEVDIDPTLLSSGSCLLSVGESIRMRSEKGMAATMRVITR